MQKTNSTIKIYFDENKQVKKWPYSGVICVVLNNLANDFFVNNQIAKKERFHCHFNRFVAH